MKARESMILSICWHDEILSGVRQEQLLFAAGPAAKGAVLELGMDDWIAGSVR